MTAAPPQAPPPGRADAGAAKDSSADLAVCIRHLDYFYGTGDIRKQVLFDINLDLPHGQIVIMTGPSGSGKTTLLTLVGGLRTLEAGSLRVEDRELVGLSNAELVDVRRNIGFIFQAHNLFESLSALQNVAMAIELHDNRTKHEQAVRILTQLGLKERINYRPKSLSGGQKQRVAIARALVNQPRLILADEPTAALDKDSGREVVNLMQKLTKEQNCTILMVTHDNRILDVADRIINLVDGTLVSDRSFEDYIALHSPKSLDPSMFIM
ncbi:MAG: ATP-binding cassette domain-containing protein [Cyanobacteria bacterium P01_F01_bin.33]